jgi:hypothetical protein
LPVRLALVLSTFAMTGLALASPLQAETAKKAPAKAAPAKKATPKAGPAKKPASAKGDVTRAQMMAQVKTTFNRADTNHDGFMSRAEFAARMNVVLNREAPPTKADAQRMLDAANRAFDDVDANHDGKLSLAEASKRPLAAFDMMDANHDGILTVAEKAAAHQQAPALPTGPTIGDQQGPGR